MPGNPDAVDPDAQSSDAARADAAIPAPLAQGPMARRRTDRCRPWWLKDLAVPNQHSTLCDIPRAGWLSGRTSRAATWWVRLRQSARSWER